MTEIGGYLPLELAHGKEHHTAALSFNSARNALLWLLTANKPERIWLPRYSCPVIRETVERAGVKPMYYALNDQLEPAGTIRAAGKDILLLINYFGLKNQFIEAFKSDSGKIVVDNAQAFFAKVRQGTYTFCSCRKFFGVPDGAYLYTDRNESNCELPVDESYDRMSHLLRRRDTGARSGYADFQRNEKDFATLPLRRMSMLTRSLMRSIDYAAVAAARRRNFQLLHHYLRPSNRLRVGLPGDAVPMAYPFFPHSSGLRDRLSNEGIFVPQLWPGVAEYCEPASLEARLAEDLLPLPIDQNYGTEDMKRLLKTIG